MASTVPTYKQAFIEALEAASWPMQDGSPGPQVCYGPPRNPSREDVIVGDTALEGGAERRWAALGNRKIDEEYTLNLRVIVTNPGKDTRAAVERAFALFDVIQAVAQANPGMGIAGVTVSGIAQPEHYESVADEGSVCEIESAVSVSARI